MPTYEYHCNTCDTDFVAVCRMKDRANQQCPECGDIPERLVSQGFTHGDEPVWIDNSVRASIQSPEEAMVNPVTTRSDYNKLLKDKDIVPLT